MSRSRVAGILKNVQITSKVDDNGRQIHTVTTKVELLENGDRQHLDDIAAFLNKPIRFEFDAVQLSMGK